MTEETKRIKAEAEQAKADLHRGNISYAEAQTKVAEYVRLVNERGQVLAKEHGVPFRAVSIIGFLR
jgi:hypothetical protein